MTAAPLQLRLPLPLLPPVRMPLRRRPLPLRLPPALLPLPLLLRQLLLVRTLRLRQRPLPPLLA